MSEPDGDPLTYTWSNVSGPGTVTFTGDNSPDIEAAFSLVGTYELQVIASDDQNVGIAQKVTITSDGYNQLTTLVQSNPLLIKEGTTKQLAIRLNAPPADTIILALSKKSGGAEFSLPSANTLTFTPSNWNSFQYIPVSAAEDDSDITNDKAQFSIVKSSGTNPTSSIVVDVHEVDDDITLTLANDGNGSTSPSVLTYYDTDDMPISCSATPHSEYIFSSWSGNRGILADPNSSSTILQTSENETITANFQFTGVVISVETDSLIVDEGSSSKMRIKLSKAPLSSVTLLVSKESGDTDISITGSSSLVFTSGNWDAYQEITLQSLQDNDESNDNATFSIKKTNGPGLIHPINVDVRERDDDVAPAEVNILIIGSTQSFSTIDKNNSQVNHEETFNPQGIVTQLQNILSQDSSISSANVTFDDVYAKKNVTTYTIGKSQFIPEYYRHSLAQYYYWPENRTSRLDIISSKGTEKWDYVVLIGDPYIMATMPGMFAEGVNLQGNRAINPTQY